MKLKQRMIFLFFVGGGGKSKVETFYTACRIYQISIKNKYRLCGECSFYAIQLRQKPRYFTYFSLKLRFALTLEKFLLLKKWEFLQYFELVDREHNHLEQT